MAVLRRPVANCRLSAGVAVRAKARGADRAMALRNIIMEVGAQREGGGDESERSWKDGRKLAQGDRVKMTMHGRSGVWPVVTKFCHTRTRDANIVRAPDSGPFV
jgi:hypothetical protein